MPSRAGQQVTGYPFNDTNNHWIVEPAKEIPLNGRGRLVRQHDIIRLRHVNTNTTLLTHDVACPTLATNTEFTTWDGAEQDQESNTHFKLEIDDARDGQQWMTKSTHFQLIHVNTGVAMWTHTDPPLPEWAYKQQEVNGNKNLKDRTTLWLVDDIVLDPSTSLTSSKCAPLTELIIDDTTPLRTTPKEQRTVKRMSFFRKFFELQVAMLQHNAGLTDSHPYATGPINWPFLLSGISFWTGASELRQQVYLIGNVVSWWLCIMSLSVFIGVIGADQLSKRRGLMPIPKGESRRLTK